jgi:3-oxoacyl-[acyl-carrier protein] reductase
MTGSQTAIVTGASRGIGRAIAAQLSLAGYEVALISRTQDGLVDLQKTITDQGGSAFIVTADVSIPSDVDAATAAILERTGRIDVLVNNAGVSPMKNGANVPVIEMSISEWNMVLSTNLTSQFLFSRNAARTMISQKSGSIINISSAAARLGGIAAGAHYVASKAGVIGLTKVLARELGPYGVRVNCIAPGRIETPMLAAVSIDPQWAEKNVPLRRMGMPEDVADAVVFLASQRAQYFHGATLDINGGWVMY